MSIASGLPALFWLFPYFKPSSEFPSSASGAGLDFSGEFSGKNSTGDLAGAMAGNQQFERQVAHCLDGLLQTLWRGVAEVESADCRQNRSLGKMFHRPEQDIDNSGMRAASTDNDALLEITEQEQLIFQVVGAQSATIEKKWATAVFVFSLAWNWAAEQDAFAQR